jgi:hypothetical protein
MKPVLRSVRFGFNPNSSSLGADVTGLLLGGGIAVLIAVALAVWIRLSARLGGGTQHGGNGTPHGNGGSPS